MSLRSWWQRRKSGPDQLESGDPVSQVRWLAAADNPFRVDVLDCSAFARSMVSVTSSAEVARRFSELRASRGEHCRGKQPEDPSTVSCRLTYPVMDRQDGPLGLAAEMEDKWDVFLLDGELYFTRSWSGAIGYKARVAFNNSAIVISEVISRRDPELESPIAVVDFLIKSHVYGLVAPHPLPVRAGASVMDLANWSFSTFGRRGWFGTTHDVTRFEVRMNEAGQCRLDTATSPVGASTPPMEGRGLSVRWPSSG